MYYDVNFTGCDILPIEYGEYSTLKVCTIIIDETIDDMECWFNCGNDFSKY